jgi:hypothetical protein
MGDFVTGIGTGTTSPSLLENQHQWREIQKIYLFGTIWPDCGQRLVPIEYIKPWWGHQNYNISTCGRQYNTQL